MFSFRHWACAVRPLLIPAGLLAGCDTSVDLQSPGAGGPDSLKADLSPGAVEAPESLRLDALLQMSVGVMNTGERAAGPGWVVRVFLSTDAQIDSSDQQVDQFVATRELPAGAQDAYLRNKKLTGVGAGAYYIGSIVDATGIVPELDETNNTLTTPPRITLLPGPAGP